MLGEKGAKGALAKLEKVELHFLKIFVGSHKVLPLGLFMLNLVGCLSTAAGQNKAAHT